MPCGISDRIPPINFTPRRAEDQRLSCPTGLPITFRQFREPRQVRVEDRKRRGNLRGPTESRFEKDTLSFPRSAWEHLLATLRVASGFTCETGRRASGRAFPRGTREEALTCWRAGTVNGTNNLLSRDRKGAGDSIPLRSRLNNKLETLSDRTYSRRAGSLGDWSLPPVAKPQAASPAIVRTHVRIDHLLCRPFSPRQRYDRLGR